MEPTHSNKARNVRRLVALCVTVVALVALGAHPAVRAWLDPERLEHGIQSLGHWGPLALFGLGALSPLLFLPRWPIAVASGLLYGVVWGSLLANTASLMGAVFHYAAVRWFLKHNPSGWIARVRAKAIQWPNHRAFAGLFFMRAFPLTSFVATNIISGSLKIPWRTYISASFLGMIPSSVMYATLGKAAKEPGAGWYTLIIALLACTIAGTLWIQRRGRD